MKLSEKIAQVKNQIAQNKMKQAGADTGDLAHLSETQDSLTQELHELEMMRLMEKL